MPQPRDWLRCLSTAFAAAGLAATVAACACTDTEQQTFTIATPADPPLQFRIDSCKVDPGACPALCMLALDRAGYTGAVDDCQVSFTATSVTVSVSYEVDDHGFGCPAAPAPTARAALTGLRAATTNSLAPTPRSTLLHP